MLTNGMRFCLLSGEEMNSYIILFVVWIALVWGGALVVAYEVWPYLRTTRQAQDALRQLDEALDRIMGK
jgi:hypothetical protein